MKACNRLVTFLVVLMAALALVGCVPATANIDGVSTGTGGGSGGGSGSGDGTSGGGETGGEGSGGGGAGWQICKNTSYEIFDVQVWGGAGAVNYENYSGYGRFTYDGDNNGWSGGGLVRAGANTDATIPPFAMTNAVKMTFDIRGTIDPKALCLALQCFVADIIPAKVALTSYGVDSLSTEEWTSVEIPFSQSDSTAIINAFLFVVAGDWGGTTVKGSYWEIKNLDWVDSEGNSVTLTINES